MSIDKLKRVFSGVTDYDAWTLQLLKIKNSKRSGTSYLCREITLSPEGQLKEFISEIKDYYTDSAKGRLKWYAGIREYDGSLLDRNIYKIDSERDLIKIELKSLIEAIANPDVEIDPLEFRAQGYLLKGMVTIDGDECPVKIISLQNPVTTLKHKFMRAKGTFKAISDKVISLRTAVDVLVIDDTVYMLNLSGEKLFNMERAYKAVCDEKLGCIRASDIVSDFEAFSDIASKGHNPRKFVSFNDEHLKKLKNVRTRNKIAKKFNIPLVEDKFDTTKIGTTDKIVKLLCDRGMLNPFDNNPREVDGAKKWQ